MQITIGDNRWSCYFGTFHERYGMEWVVDYEPAKKDEFSINNENDKLR